MHGVRPPIWSRASSTSTSTPAAPRSRAHDRPARPAPITTTSGWVDMPGTMPLTDTTVKLASAGLTIGGRPMGDRMGQILDAACAVIVREGASALRMADVADEAG